MSVNSNFEKSFFFTGYTKEDLARLTQCGSLNHEQEAKIVLENPPQAAPQVGDQVLDNQQVVLVENMFFAIIPMEIYKEIVNFIFIEPKNITTQEVRSSGRTIVNFSLVCKGCDVASKDQLLRLKKIDLLVTKYCAYNFSYQNHLNTGYCNGNPQLLDALFTDCQSPYANHSVRVYTCESEDDIKQIVKLTPQSITCTLGILRCRTNVTPLFAACANEKISIIIIEFLLENGANPNSTITFNCFKQIRILEDLEIFGISPDRIKAIKVIFEKFGCNK